VSLTNRLTENAQFCNEALRCLAFSIALSNGYTHQSNYLPHYKICNEEDNCSDVYNQITNRSFTCASPYLWNQLPSSFRQPHSVHCPTGSPHPAHITSSQSPPSLSSPITASYLSLQT